MSTKTIKRAIAAISATTMLAGAVVVPEATAQAVSASSPSNLNINSIGGALATLFLILAALGPLRTIFFNIFRF
ncbi:Uncharacterised protein [Corynebacterium kutscheri]|uniref:Uncharacterized protein n=1 Tax=Corynebacterium kutscheri TaxID=35755 RepID=A0A0F6TDH9_9CORY|nr:hypothetical protein [Corynebacterium kutscheri]AKE41201.1 hypothetical protein UL82_05125 [Corynebacterium kutscheri]VEH08477.1 Uncharacterised protein [Corynebacterium kutscheri]VEH09523.1 Uncharacterised protein [Corynebacterium kutscheri]VEH79606.1 Uncharacterised protein [Corynebacterium kutscheri]